MICNFTTQVTYTQPRICYFWTLVHADNGRDKGWIIHQRYTFLTVLFTKSVCMYKEKFPLHTFSECFWKKKYFLIILGSEKRNHPFLSTHIFFIVKNELQSLDSKQINIIYFRSLLLYVSSIPLKDTNNEKTSMPCSYTYFP